MLLTPDQIDFSSDIGLSVEQLQAATLPEVIQTVEPQHGKWRNKPERHLQHFVELWLEKSDEGNMGTADAATFVTEFGLAPDEGVAATVVRNTAILPEDLTGLSSCSWFLNDKWGDKYGPDARLGRRFVLKDCSREFGILIEDPQASTGYTMAQAPKPAFVP